MKHTPRSTVSSVQLLLPFFEVRGEEASNGHGQPLPGAVGTEPAGPENWS